MLYTVVRGIVINETLFTRLLCNMTYNFTNWGWIDDFFYKYIRHARQQHCSYYWKEMDNDQYDNKGPCKTSLNDDIGNCTTHLSEKIVLWIKYIHVWIISLNYHIVWTILFWTTIYI